MAKKVSTKPPKGTRDFLPAALRRRRRVVEVIRGVYERHGFEPLETPSFERLDTLLGKYGEEGDQLVFKLLRRGQALVKGVRAASDYIQDPAHLVTGRSGETAPGAEGLLSDSGLRYDLTVPLARVYAEHAGKLPAVFKRYQIQPVWRADTPAKGRFREFYQCDLDVIGSTSLLCEAEVCGAVSQCLDGLGFDTAYIRLNHRQLLSALVEQVGLPLSRESEVIIALDKLDKIGRAGVEAELGEKGVPEAARRQLLDLVTEDADLERLAQALSGSARAEAALSELRELLSVVKGTPAEARLRFSPTLARGLGYYTGSIFEIASPEFAGSLGGGGRYDGLIGMFLGRKVPACGFSIGLERILVLLEQQAAEALDPRAELILATTDKARLPGLLPLAYRLRAAGGSRVEVCFKAQGLGRLRKLADEAGVPYLAVDLGEGQLNLWSRAEPERTDRVCDESALISVLGAQP